MVAEKTIIENIDGKKFKIEIIEPESLLQASFTHYLHNHKNGVSKFYKETAVDFVKEILEKENSKNKVTIKVAEEALQYLIFNYKNTIPFPAPEKPTFKFIDLFAGI
ncbi:MAG: hypothetical protein B7Z06_06320 [Flavobacteriales bacterium 32-35-8]|nr:MAG: hypothetical protein B7Z06_06320 [Flavobacteriales bacterium 32-35-8]